MDQWAALQQLLAHMQANGGGRQDARDNSAEMQRLALEQAARMRQPHLRQNAVPGGGSMANTGAPMQGMPGTPGGPVEESPLMKAERDNQWLMGLLGSMAGGGIGGAIGGVLGFLLGMVPGMAARGNSGLANIRDVWSDQMRMSQQEQTLEKRRQAEELEKQFSNDALARALRGY